MSVNKHTIDEANETNKANETSDASNTADAADMNADKASHEAAVESAHTPQHSVHAARKAHASHVAHASHAAHARQMAGLADTPTHAGKHGSQIASRGMKSVRGNWHARPRIGIMGGTFDPIHNGHLVAASEVAWVYDLDEVIFVPTGRPVFKLDQHVTNAEDRYLMTVIATASNSKFTVSRVDIDRPGVTYTIDTLRDIRATHPDADLFFITGADAVAEIMQWKDADHMWDLAHFVAVTRPGYTSPDHAPLPEGKVDVLEIPALAISSTDVRRRAERNEPVWYLVPDGVVQYINKHGIYQRHDTVAS